MSLYTGFRGGKGFALLCDLRSTVPHIYRVESERDQAFVCFSSSGFGVICGATSGVVIVDITGLLEVVLQVLGGLIGVAYLKDLNQCKLLYSGIYF